MNQQVLDQQSEDVIAAISNSPDRIPANPSVDLLPFDYARIQGLVWSPEQETLFFSATTPTCALVDARRFLGTDVALCPKSAAEIEELLRSTYANRRDSSARVMEDIQGSVDIESAAQVLEQTADLLDSDDDAPIIRLLNAILAEALKERASDIHIEPYEQDAHIRFRLDGVLRTILNPSNQIAPLLISRVKVMSKLDIAEKRLPQDGRMTVRLGGRSIDMRVSTMPSTYGERVVLRLLDKQAGQLQVDDLGMSEVLRLQLVELINRPHGIILVTGPTGSGKTTTLYAALQQMDRLQRNIMTVEDPVEYDLAGISQTQINLRAGMTFAKGLRAILRQDPDVILIGEIRDSETAEIATQASLTGHLVLSTLHTNTAAGAVTRMQDLGVDGFLLASTLRGVMAQRLVRQLCQHCKVPLAADGFTAERLSIDVGTHIYSPGGCEHCNHTGYDGRLGIFELVTITSEIQRLIHDGASEVEIEQAIRVSVPSILESGFQLVRQGRTTLEEVLRVTSA